LAGIAILPATAMMGGTDARAANIDWTGSGNWFNAQNWQIQPRRQNQQPGAGDNVYIYNPGPIIDKPGAAANTLTVTGPNGSFSIVSGGTLTVGNQTILGNGGDNYGNATVSGKGSLWTANRITFGSIRGVGSATVSDGGKVVAQSTILSPYSSLTITGAGSEWKSGNTIMNIGSKTIVSDGGTLAFTSFVSMYNGSNLFVGGGSTDPADAKAPGMISVADRPISMDGGSVINFNHTDQTRKYEFAPVVTGTGTLEFINGATVVTGNSGSFTGPTNVREQGTLVVKGSLAGSSVNVWGILAGNGNVGSVTVNGNGKVEPGNSIGTLHIKNNFNMASGSDYVVELNGTSSDRIEVGGKATILSSRFEIERYDTDSSPVVPGTTYTILTTGGGLTVQAPTIAVADFPFLNFTLSEDGYNGYLTTSRSAERFAELASTANEIAVANALDSATLTPEWAQVVGAGAADASAAFTSLANASIHASALGVLSEQSHFLRDAVTDRLRGAIGGEASPAVAGVTTVPTGTAYAIWGRALGSWGSADGDANTADISDSIGGLISGVDVTVDDAWRFGLAGGYSQSWFSSPDIAASGSSDSYHVALYGGWQAASGLALRGGAAYSWNEVDISRQVAVVGLAGAADGSYSAPTAQIFGEGAYRIAYGAAAFEPFANLAYVHIDGDISETGIAAMNGTSELDTTYTTLGLRASGAVAAGLTVRGTLGWRHAFGDVTPEASLAFQPGAASVSLAGVPIAADALVTELGVDFALNESTTLGLSYSGQYATDAYENSAQANFSLRF